MNPELISAIIGLVQTWHGPLMPFLVDAITQYVENSKWRFVISILTTLLVTSLLNLDKLLTGNYAELLGTVSFVFVQAQIMYKLYYEKSDARAKVFGDDIQR